MNNSNYCAAWIFSLHLVMISFRQNCDYLVSYLVTFLSAFGNWNVLPEPGSVLNGGGVNSEYNMKLTPWSRVLPEKLTGLQLFEQCRAFYDPWTFITAFPTEYEMLYCNVVHLQPTYVDVAPRSDWLRGSTRYLKRVNFKLHWQYVWKTLLYKMSLSYTLFVLHATADAKYICIFTVVGACRIESEIYNLEKLC